MRKTNTTTRLALALTGAGVLAGGIAVLATRSGHEAVPAKQEPRPIAAAATPTSPKDEHKAGSALVVTAADTREARDATLRPAGDGLEAEGLKVAASGAISYASQAGKSIQQSLVGVDVVEGTKVVRQLARGASAKPAAGKDAIGSKAVFHGYFEGVDLEYRYDGKRVEELLHLDDALKQQLVANKQGLRLRSVMPGVSAKDSRIGARGPAAVDSGARKGDVTLTTGGHEFLLPEALALDGSGKQEPLARTFDFKASGLEVAVDVPAEWLAEAQGKVVIDPTILEVAAGLSVQGNNNSSATLPGANYRTSSMVKDSQGRLHVLFQQVFTSATNVVTRQVMYTASDDGSRWDRPVAIAALTSNANTNETEHDVPFVVIDSQNRLHAVWRDFSNLGTVAGRGILNNSTTRLHYAQCPNACAAKQWSFNGVAGGTLLYTGAALPGVQYQFNATMAVDANDRVWIMWRESSPEIWKLGWVDVATNPNAFVTAPASAAPPGPQNYDMAQLVVDNSNVLHVFESTSGAGCCTLSVVHAYFNPANNTWISRPTLNLFGTQTLPGFAGYGFGSCGSGASRGMWATVDRFSNVSTGGDIHIATTVRGTNCGGAVNWVPYYARWNSATNVWSEQGVVANHGGDINFDSPQLTVDDAGTIHFFYVFAPSGINRIYYASKLAGPGQPFTTTRIYNQPTGVAGTRHEPEFSLLPRWTYPVGVMDRVPANQVSFIMLNYDTLNPNTAYYSTIRYVSPTLVSDSPVLQQPFDHRFVATGQVTFQWDRTASDDPASLTTPIYYLEISRTSDMASPTVIPAFRTTSYTLSQFQALADGYYYWRVRAESAAGVGYSQIFELAVEASGPQAPQLIAPANNSDPGTRTPTFVWSDVSGQ